MAVLHHTGMKITTNTSIVDTFREKLRSLCIYKRWRQILDRMQKCCRLNV